MRAKKGSVTSHHHPYISLCMYGWDNDACRSPSSVVRSNTVTFGQHCTHCKGGGEKQQGPLGLPSEITQTREGKRGERKAASREKMNVHTPQYLLD